jgi:hypothetical protein
MDDEADLTEADRSALKMAVDLTLADDPPDPGRVEQVTAFLHERPWRDVASFCSYHQQVRRLCLKPFQRPPAWIETREQAEAIIEAGSVPAANDASVDVGDLQSAKLALAMLDLNISVFHPDPSRAISEARRQRGSHVA